MTAAAPILSGARLQALLPRWDAVLPCNPGPQVTKQHNEECKQLLRLMGVPVIDAPSEAEAQCAAMAKAGVVYGVATEDMDCLTFGAPKCACRFAAPTARAAPTPRCAGLG